MEIATSCKEQFCGRQVRGARRENGGQSGQPTTLRKSQVSGSAKSGTLHLLTTMAQASRFIAFTATSARVAGLPMPATTKTYVHRVARPLGIQLSRRSIGSRRVRRH